MILPRHMFSEPSHEWSEAGEGGGAKGNSADFREARISASCCSSSASLEASSAFLDASDAWWRRGLANMASIFEKVWGV